MLIVNDVQPNQAWPRVREIGPDQLAVSGHATRLTAWLIIRVIANLVTLLFGLWLIAAAFVALFVGLHESLGPGHPVSMVIESMVDLRWMMRRVFHDWLPWLGQVLFYNPLSRIDWHLLVLGIVFYRLRPAVSYGIASVLSRLLRPVIGRRFKITFTPDTVVIQRHLRSLRLHRNDLDGEGVTFRVMERVPQPGLMGWLYRIGWLRPSADLELPIVAAVCGRRVISIAMPPHSSEAHRIVESLLIALNQSRNETYS